MCGSKRRGPARYPGHVPDPADPVIADRVLSGRGRGDRPDDSGAAAATAWINYTLRIAKLGVAGDPVLRLRRVADGTGWYVHRVGGVSPSAGGLGARRSGNVGDRGVVFLLRHLWIEDGRSLGIG